MSEAPQFDRLFAQLKNFRTRPAAIEAINNNRNYIGIDISKEYVAMAKKRIKQET